MIIAIIIIKHILFSFSDNFHVLVQCICNIALFFFRPSFKGNYFTRAYSTEVLPKPNQPEGEIYPSQIHKKTDLITGQ